MIPPRTYTNKTEFSSNQERLEYEDQQINDPDPFEDPNIEEKIFKIIEEKGVRVYRECTLIDIIPDKDKGNVCEKVIFKKNQIEGTQENASSLPGGANQQQGGGAGAHAHGRDNLTGTNYYSSQVQQQNSLEFDAENLDEAQESDQLELNSRFLITSGKFKIILIVYNL